MARLKEILRKNRWLHNVATKVYRKTFYKVRPAHMKRMRQYRKDTAPAEVRKLKTYGFTHIKCFNTTSWRFGKGLDHAYRRYYTARLGGKKVFIKVAKNDATICNEIDVGSALQNCSVLRGGQTLVSDKKFAENTMMLAMGFTEGLRSFQLPDTVQDFESQCREFLEILDALRSRNIVHADIHKNNLMLDKQGHLVLLDYGISMILGQTNSVDYKARPGTFYRENNGVRVYDDAYSFVSMLEGLGLPAQWKDVQAYQQVENQIDAHIGMVQL